MAAALFGIGGGALITPGAVDVGFRQYAAHATSLAAIAFTAAVAVVPSPRRQPSPFPPR